MKIKILLSLLIIITSAYAWGNGYSIYGDPVYADNAQAWKNTNMYGTHDYLAQKADIVVRFQGGPNAGHTVVCEGVKYKFKLIPSGAPSEKEVVIANGCVIDPQVLLDEIENLKALNKQVNLKLSSTAHVIFPFHRVLDGLEEISKGSEICRLSK